METNRCITRIPRFALKAALTLGQRRGMMSEQGTGGYSVIVCHDCQQPVSFDTDFWSHLDGTALCYEVVSGEVR